MTAQNAAKTLEKFFSYEIRFFKIHKIYLLYSTCNSRIKPFQIIGAELVLPERTVHEHTVPLPSLRLVASYGIGIFQLEGVEILVLPDRFPYSLLASAVGIIGADP